MFIDFRKTAHDLIETDLCIIGAGPAGISIATEFANTSASVCLLESGGFKLEARTQALCEGESTGLPYWLPLDKVRYRYFGGSTSKWGAWLAPFNEIDFSRREWVPNSGWPLSYADMEPYYVRAHELCGVPGFTYDLKAVGFGTEDLQPFQSEKLVHRLWQFGAPTRFGTMYRRQLRLAENIRVFLHANVIELETDESDTLVTGAKIASLDGNRSVVRAKVFVLATGGLEVPRLLLLSRTSQGTGLGNHHDLVGRFFMEHPHIDIASVELTGDRSWVREYELQRMGQRVVRPHLCIPEEVQRQHNLVNCSCALETPDEDRKGYGALRRLKKNIMDPYENGSLLRDIACTFANPLDLAFGLYSKLRDYNHIPRGSPPRKILLRIRGEQIPEPSSRVTLSEKRDALGLRRVRLDWQMNGDEKQTMRAMSRFLADEFERLGLGKVHCRSWLKEPERQWPIDLWGGPHHMGTTRMNASPTRGVVDQDCRVHGAKNLYVAGSGVFPTSGYANPTLTLIALAVRLADHLDRKLSHQPSIRDQASKDV